MNTNESELLFKDEVYAIVGAAMEVSNELGNGFLESVYQEALGLEFEARQIPYLARPCLEIAYKGRPLLKEFIPDYFCYDQIIVEIKAIKALSNLEYAQLLNYLKASGKPVGVLLNFGTPKLEWKRMVYQHTNQPLINRE
jgi:GxxExxY protein